VSGPRNDFDPKTRERQAGRKFAVPTFALPNKCRILINHQPGRFDIATQRATRLELAAFSHENIAFNRPSHLHRFRPDFTAYERVLFKCERSGGIDCAFHLAIDAQLV
jgi:hypothetical protein